MCVPANRWGSDRALWGEVWGREGLNDGHSFLTGGRERKETNTQKTQKHAEMRQNGMEVRLMS